MRWQCATLGVLALVACQDVQGPRPRPGPLQDSAQNGTALIEWYTLEPRVISIGTTDSVLLTVRLNGSATVRAFTGNGETYTLRRNGALQEIGLPVSALLTNYRPGDHHHLGAQLEVAGSDVVYNISFNVRDGSIPPATVQGLAPGVQRTEHVINIRYDSTTLGTQMPVTPIREVYQYLPDVYDFIFVVEAVRAHRDRSYQGVRNDVRGIGVTIFDLSAQYGSASRLQGIIRIPGDDAFDLAETGNLHEIGHRWIQYIRAGQLATGIPHWPLSSLAYGIMGLTAGNAETGVTFPYRIVPQGNAFVLNATLPARDFNDFELYLMGLVPPEDVAPAIVFRDQRLLTQVRNGAILPGPVDTVSMRDVTAVEGERRPDYTGAPRTFRIATLVLSRGRLLTPSELAFFDHMASRGEAEVELPFTQGLQRGQTRPFFLATGQRARLLTGL